MRGAKRNWMIMSAVWLALLFTGSQADAAGSPDASRCSCRNGQVFELGWISYLKNGDRFQIAKIETTGKAPAEECGTVSLDQAEIFPIGSPEEFYVERRIRKIVES